MIIFGNVNYYNYDNIWFIDYCNYDNIWERKLLQL